MYGNIKFKAIFVIVIVIISCFYAFPLDKRIDLGLDLQGGMHIVLGLDMKNIPAKSKGDAIEITLEKIRNRIDEFGVKEPIIKIQGEEHIIVQLPGMTDRSRALNILRSAGFLEFRLVSDDLVLLKKALEDNVPEGYELKYLDDKPLLIDKKTALTGDSVSEARVDFEQFGQPYISLKFSSEGATVFSQITADNIHKRLAIVLDGKVHSAPAIRERIPNGEAQITGQFTMDEAKDLATVLKIGALPVPITIEEERTIGPLLGQDSINRGIKACAIGALLVFLFMAFYYRVLGMIANVALVLNFLMILAGLSMFGATLTLPGIAGIVLTLGMAVDANVLIDERIREELKLGKGAHTAVRLGYKKALSAILDSNVTTLIAAFFLFQFGTGPIRGFAITLTMGLLSSLFTAIIVTRLIIESLLRVGWVKNLSMMELIKQHKIDFIKPRFICFALSLLILAAGLFNFFGKHKDAYGVDFKGGQLQEYSFRQDVGIEELRSLLSGLELSDLSIQEFKEYKNRFVINTSTDSAELVTEALEDNFSKEGFDVLRIEKVGPAVGKQLRAKARWAILWSLIGILAYVAIRFRHINFAVAGVIAIFHDVLISLGILVASGRTIDLLIVTALLTIAGYSINDTIVIYDRVRENARANPKLSSREIVNMSVNQTLSRTVLTTVLTLFVCFTLYFLGGQIINGFAFTLIVGFSFGVYSTIYIASPLVLAWQRNKKLT